MMFSKYISKITNTIGTVNYLQQKSKKAQQQQYSRRSSKQLLYDDGYDVDNVDSDTINHMDIDLSINGSRKNSLLDEFPPSSQIILSAAIAKLRNTLFCYELVEFIFGFVDYFSFYNFSLASLFNFLLRQHTTISTNSLYFYTKPVTENHKYSEE